ncbi:MAG: Golgi transport complex subunit 3 [Watsoniomyces obsoletus]|nr:MAG: Golgi transport complex subunit 3 [Watsoniomyces obsoletus]
MRLSSRTSARPSFLHLLATVLLFSSALGQNPPPRPDDDDRPTNAPATTADVTTQTTQTTPPSNSPSNTATNTRPSSTAPSNTASTSASNPQSSESQSESASSSGDSSTSGSSSSRPGATITPTGTTASGSTRSAPRITASITGSGSSAGALPTGLPTLAGQYPAPTVPPTANAPFMKQSTLPEGTVFIVVGAFLGFLGFSVLAWRGLVAWSVHRSVARAAREQNMADSKVMLRPRGNGLYAAGAGSTLSLDRLSHNPRSSSYGRKSYVGHASSGSLFFSPTAARGVSMIDPTTSRPQSYLPGGYYPAANSTAAGGAGTVHLGPPPGSSHNQSRRSRGPSPPASPSLSPSRGVDPNYARASHVGVPSQASTSSLNLSMPPQGRAPSAYLEDLFESHQSQPTRTTHERY